MAKQTVREQFEQLPNLHGEEWRRAVARIMHDARDLDSVRRAIGMIGEAEDPAFRTDLTQKYEWCDSQPERRDGGGYIRAAIVRAIRPISDPSDVGMFQRAMSSYEIDGAMELNGDLRAAGLLAMNDINPDLAANWAARLVLDPQMTFSGDPANTAIRLLASHGNLAPIFGLVSWGEARTDVLAEGLRNLVEIQDELMPILVDRYLDNDDEQIILGLFDLLLAHRSRDSWASEIERWFRSTTVMDLYGIVAIQLVASRSEPLITMLRNLRETEVDAMRKSMLDQALELV